MKITCTKEKLKRALNLTSRVVGTVSTLPILNNLLLKTEAGQLFIFSTNLELAVKTWVGGQIEENGALTVPAKTLNEFVANTQEEKITLATKGNDLLIKTKQTESVLKGLSADEFPLIPEIKAKISCAVPANELAKALGQVAFATAFSETQPELSGVLFNFEGTELRLAATDRYRLAEKVVMLPQPVTEAQKIIIPNRAVSELGRVLSENSKTAEVMISDNQILFRTENSELISRLIEAQYPDYQQIIPKAFRTNITVSSAELANGMKLAGLFALDNNNVELNAIKGQNTIVLKAVSQRAGSNITQIPCLVEGEENNIIFNHRYILDCLNHINSEKVVLSLINSGSPAMLVPEKTKDYLYLVMPIKI